MLPWFKYWSFSLCCDHDLKTLDSIFISLNFFFLDSNQGYTHLIANKTMTNKYRNGYISIMISFGYRWLFIYIAHMEYSLYKFQCLQMRERNMYKRFSSREFCIILSSMSCMWELILCDAGIVNIPMRAERVWKDCETRSDCRESWLIRAL